MRTTKFDGSDVRKILIGMVTNQTVCSRISSQWTAYGLFKSEWANQVGSWCVSYIKQYGKPPKSQLTAIFENWAESTVSSDKTIDAVETFLHYLSDEYVANPDQSSEYLLDIAAEHFNKVQLEIEIEQAQNEIERGFVADAQSRLSHIGPVDLGLGDYSQPSDDFDVWNRAFDVEKRRPLVNYRGDAAKFFGDAFMQGEFYSFMAQDKTGKTACLLDFVYRAVRARNRVVYFDMGDSSEEEIIVRLASRASGLPEYAGKYRQPLGFDENGNVLSKEKEFEAVDAGTAFREFSKICNTDDAFRLSCHPNSSIGAEGISAILSDFERDGWSAPICVIDYADIMAPPKGSTDKLDAIDDTWKMLRRMSQEKNILVVTATQANAASYGNEKGFLGKQHFSGRKTKLAHVNGMLGINATEKEKADHMARWKWIVRRKDRHRGDGYLTVAGNFDVENPVILSRFGKSFENEGVAE